MLWPGFRLSSSNRISLSVRESPAGQPSITTPKAFPWDSPHVVILKKFPKELPGIKMILSTKRDNTIWLEIIVSTSRPHNYKNLIFLQLHAYNISSSVDTQGTLKPKSIVSILVNENLLLIHSQN